MKSLKVENKVKRQGYELVLNEMKEFISKNESAKKDMMHRNMFSMCHSVRWRNISDILKLTNWKRGQVITSEMIEDIVIL